MIVNAIRIVFLCGMFVLLGGNNLFSENFKIEISPRVIGPSEVEVAITSNIPGTIDVMVSLGLSGQKPDDVFIGTNKRVVVKNGRATIKIGKPDLPAGKYELEVSFYPRWGPQDAPAKAAGVSSNIHARKFVNLIGSGEPAKAVQKRENDQRWVMVNVHTGTRWNHSNWVDRFGEPRQLPTTRWNPKIIKAYYFKSLDMTIFVNELKGEVSHWRIGQEIK